MQSGYESIIWIDDMDGRRFACFAEGLGENQLDNELVFNVEEFSRCLDVDELVGQRTG